MTGRGRIVARRYFFLMLGVTFLLLIPSLPITYATVEQVLKRKLCEGSLNQLEPVSATITMLHSSTIPATLELFLNRKTPSAYPCPWWIDDHMRSVAFHLLIVLISATMTDTVERTGFTPDTTEAYKTAGKKQLELHFFHPEGHSSSDKRPAIVFFFGGGWINGSPSQFYPHCAHLASRGTVAMAADYRVKSRDSTTPRGESVR